MLIYFGMSSKHGVGQGLITLPANLLDLTGDKVRMHAGLFL